MISTKLRVFSGGFTHSSAGDTFSPTQFGFFWKFPACLRASTVLSGMPGELRRNAVAGIAGSCVAQDAASTPAKTGTAHFLTIDFICPPLLLTGREPARRCRGRSSP
jgi:hypothetical protein